MPEIAQSIVDEVQAVADHTQSEAWRYEVRNGRVYEIRAYPRPRSSGERAPVPLDDREGTLHERDGKILRCRASAVDIQSGRRFSSLFESGFEEARRLHPEDEEAPIVPSVREGLRHAGEALDDGLVRPPGHLREWVSQSRRRGLRRYDDDFVPVEFEWVEDEVANLGADPIIRERDDLDVEYPE